MNYHTVENGIVTLENACEVVEKLLFSVWDNEQGEYLFKFEELITLQNDVFEYMANRGEAHDDELGQDYLQIVCNYAPKDLSLKFVIDFYKDMEYLVVKHSVLDIV